MNIKSVLNLFKIVIISPLDAFFNPVSTGVACLLVSTGLLNSSLILIASASIQAARTLTEFFILKAKFAGFTWEKFFTFRSSYLKLPFFLCSLIVVVIAKSDFKGGDIEGFFFVVAIFGLFLSLFFEAYLLKRSIELLKRNVDVSDKFLI